MFHATYKPTASWVTHITTGFPRCYSCSWNNIDDVLFWLPSMLVVQDKNAKEKNAKEKY